MKIEYAGTNTLFHLSNGITISYYNENYPLVFFSGIKEIGRYNLAASRYTAEEIVNFADQVNSDTLVDYFV